MSSTDSGHMEDFVRYRLRAYGRVQGVGFRWFVYRLAQDRGLTGFARNEWDESVSLELQGRKKDIELSIADIYRGNYVIAVEHMDMEEIKTDPHETDFLML